jgi:hypothetical protein
MAGPSSGRLSGLSLPMAAISDYKLGMSPSSDPPPSPLVKPKISAEERRLRQQDRLMTIRLRMAIGRELDERGITTPAEIGEALGMPAAEAVKLMNRHRWHEGDVALLEAAVARLGVQVPHPPQL